MTESKISAFISLVLSLLMVVCIFVFSETLLVPAIVSIVIFLIVEKLVSFYQEKQRTRKLKAIAIAMGLDFHKKGDEQVVPIVEDMQMFQGAKPITKSFLNNFIVIFSKLSWMLFPLFGITSRITKIKIRNIFKGKNQGVLFIICDLHIKRTISGDIRNSSIPFSPTKSSQTVIIFISENLHLPEFRLTKKPKPSFLFPRIINPIAEQIAKQIVKLLGHRQSQPQFSKLYNLQARQQVHYQIFSDRICTFYEAEQNLCTEAKYDRLICYRANTIVQPQELQSFLETGFRALELFKMKTQEVASAYTIQPALTDDSDDLSSARNINHAKLRDLLKAGKWKEADRETTSIILYILGMEEDTSSIEGELRVESMTKLPCTDLHTIDQLWMKYSQGRFGFSVQKDIWQKLGGQPDKYHWKDTIAVNRVNWQFTGCVGWSKFFALKKYDKLIFSLDAPPGHLPVLWHEWTLEKEGYAAPLDRWMIFSRMETCAKQFSS